MAEIMMSVPIDVTIVGADKKKKKVKVEYRDPTKQETKDAKERYQLFQDLNLRMNTISAKYESALKKADYSDKLGIPRDALKYQKDADELVGELNAVLEEIKGIGGDDFNEKQAQANFDNLISGDGVDKLKEVAEIKGHIAVMSMLTKAKDEVEGKH